MCGAAFPFGSLNEGCRASVEWLAGRRPSTARSLSRPDVTLASHRHEASSLSEREVEEAAQALVYIIVTDRRFTDLYRWGNLRR